MRRLLLTAAVAAGMTGLLPAAPAQAYDTCLAGTICGYYWYADPYHTDLNGYSISYIECGGGVSQWGLLQGYRVYYSAPC